MQPERHSVDVHEGSLSTLNDAPGLAVWDIVLISLPYDRTWCPLKRSPKKIFSFDQGRGDGRSMMKKYIFSKFFIFLAHHSWLGRCTPDFMVSNCQADLDDQFKLSSDPLRPKMRAPYPFDWPVTSLSHRSSVSQPGGRVESDHSFYSSHSALSKKRSIIAIWCIVFE